MFVAMIFVFVVGYILIALEHPIRVNKSATALLLGVILWVMLILGGEKILVNTEALKHYFENVIDGSFMHWVTDHELLEHLGEISQIIFFLMGAMTIVEMVDSYEGFRIITDKIKTTKRSSLLWVTSILTFFMSAALDNLTTSIVMVALLRKLIDNEKDRWFFAGMVVVAANAGGAWSPIGDVTTIMLWIAGKVSTVNIITMTFLPSLVSMLVPLIILSFTLKGYVKRPAKKAGDVNGTVGVSSLQSNIIFFIGVGGLLFVPFFKSYTHLPPYLGMLFSLGVIWVATEIFHKQREVEKRAGSRHLTIVGVLRKIDVPSILFFLGILIAVSALETVGHLELLAESLHEHVGNLYVINIIIGVLSAIVDNVPLVAGAMGMYNFPTDHYFWEFLAYCAGTGGSILIIGSAAGVAVMGMEHIDFIWYMKRISLLALVGYLAGAAFYILQEESGILEAHDGAEKAIMINLEDRQEVIKYLTSVEFVTESGDELAKSESLHFIYFPDEKSGDTYMGYYAKAKEGGNEEWDGKLNKQKAEIEKVTSDQYRISILDKSFLLKANGELHEELEGTDEGIKVLKLWKPLIQEE
jgi:Na+/H+ antiporter NhaD/arsenite permease-like protein